MFKGPIACSPAQLIVRQVSAKTETLLYLPHIWKGWLQGTLIGRYECLAGGVVTNIGDVTVPFVTSQRDSFQNFVQSRASKRIEEWTFRTPGEFIGRLEAHNIARKLWILHNMVPLNRWCATSPI